MQQTLYVPVPWKNMSLEAYRNCMSAILANVGNC